MQHIVNTVTGLLAVGLLTDVAFDETEVSPLRGSDKGLDFIQIALVTGGKVVQADNALVELEQGFQQIAADKASHAGDEPGAGLGGQAGLQLLVGGHFTSLFIAACARLVCARAGFLVNFGVYNRKSLSAADSRYFRSYSTWLGLPKARMAAAPMVLNWWWATAMMMPS